MPNHAVKDSNKEFLKLVSSMQQTTNTSNMDNNSNIKEEKQKWFFNVITLFLSLLSIVVSVFVFFKSRELTIKYNNLVAGQQALQIREDISSARRRYEDLCLQSNSNNPDIIKYAINSSIEDICNMYDLACSLYISGSLNQKNFKQQYFNEIKNIVEDDNFKDKYEPSTTEYQSTKTVYENWFKWKITLFIL